MGTRYCTQCLRGAHFRTKDMQRSKYLAFVLCYKAGMAVEELCSTLMDRASFWTSR